MLGFRNHLVRGEIPGQAGDPILSISKRVFPRYGRGRFERNALPLRGIGRGAAVLRVEIACAFPFQGFPPDATTAVFMTR